jgi:hypothetical protein
MSRASATTETMMCRTAYSPITMPSSPSITFHTRIPPASSAANALMNEKMQVEDDGDHQHHIGHGER